MPAGSPLTVNCTAARRQFELLRWEQGEVVGTAEGIYATAQQYLRFVGSCDRIVDKKFKLEIIEVPGLPNLRNPHARAAARAIPRN
jgi:hypothetical protein